MCRMYNVQVRVLIQMNDVQERVDRSESQPCHPDGQNPDVRL